jgi:hypothetical protein
MSSRETNQELAGGRQLWPIGFSLFAIILFCVAMFGYAASQRIVITSDSRSAYGVHQ